MEKIDKNLIYDLNNEFHHLTTGSLMNQLNKLKLLYSKNTAKIPGNLILRLKTELNKIKNAQKEFSPDQIYS